MTAVADSLIILNCDYSGFSPNRRLVDSHCLGMVSRQAVQSLAFPRHFVQPDPLLIQLFLPWWEQLGSTTLTSLSVVRVF